MDAKEDVVGHEPTPGPHLGGEKVGGDEHIHVRTDKLCPRGCRLALWGRREPMVLEDVAYRLVTDRIAHIGQGAHNPVVAPGAILLSYTHDQCLDFLVDPGATGRLTLSEAVTF